MLLDHPSSGSRYMYLMLSRTLDTRTLDDAPYRPHRSDDDEGEEEEAGTSSDEEEEEEEEGEERDEDDEPPALVERETPDREDAYRDEPEPRSVPVEGKLMMTPP